MEATNVAPERRKCELSPRGHQRFILYQTYLAELYIYTAYNALNNVYICRSPTNDARPTGTAGRQRNDEAYIFCGALLLQ